MFGTEPFLITLGKRCFISEGVRFIAHDGAIAIFRDRMPDLDLVAPITVGDNVYIGFRAIVLPGVHIGNNCIIGAGAVVTRDIPDDSVAVGVPARVIKDIQEYERSAVQRSVGTGAAREKSSYLKYMFPER